MITEGMKKRARNNTDKLLSLPIEDVELFEKIKQLPFFHQDSERNLDSILRTNHIYSCRHLSKHLRKNARVNTYEVDVIAGLDAYVFLSFATIIPNNIYGDLLYEFNNSIIDLPDTYFTPKDLSCYESLWVNIYNNKDKPLHQHKSNYLNQFYELRGIYHYFYHYIEKQKINDFDSLLDKIFKMKIEPPEVKVYHSLSLDHLNKIYLIPGKHYTYYENRKKYKGRIEVTKTNYTVENLKNIILKKKFIDSFVEVTPEEVINQIRKKLFG